MYQHYEARRRASRRTRAFRLILALLVAVLLATALITLLRWGKVQRPVAEEDGIKQVSTVDGAHLAVYDGTGWKTQFWNGINMGATLPGHAPGELAPTREDYLRWFAQMKEMNVDVLRVYTILNPEFYDAFHDFNSTREDPLWLIQGVWSPEEELIGPDQEGRDAYTPEITHAFQNEIHDAVQVVHGDADLPERPGHASGRFRSDVSEYMLGWMVGTEWFPYAVKVTDDSNQGMPPYSGRYFRGTAEASPFESWLAMMLDTLAEEEMEYGWQHPVCFTNWLTTDPMSHPNEANEQEDLVPLDPMHVEPTLAWKAGYFAQYHVYPYYPDFLRYEPKYQKYRNSEGEIDPYAGYLHELRAHHKGIPLFVGEFGVPSSRGMAHRGPLGRDQGYHTEEEQGKMNAGLLEQIRNEGFDGALLFAWTDEWFKFTWNTTDLEMPKNRRQMWHNRLTNEENFGVLASEAGPSEEETIHLDGETYDWARRSGEAGGNFFKRLAQRALGRSYGVQEEHYDDFDLSVSHDETYLYLMMDKRSGNWDFNRDEVDVGFGTLGSGSVTAKPAPGLTFPDGGIQFLLQMKGKGDSRMLVNSAYDQHTWLWGYRYHYIPDTASHDTSAGEFLPWNLALSRELFLPQTRERIPFQEIEVGKMREGIGDPSSPDFNSLSDWYAKDDVLEVRIPWMLLGFTDPSSLKVWDYPYETSANKDGLEAADVDGIRVYPAVRNTSEGDIDPLYYTWEEWNDPNFHERKKKSFETLSKAYEDKRLRQP
ncbi:MAG TPA: hypothetical protein VHM69_02570 [Rubrobacter sp.]|nr:hypothetical protein [Rubrobacter sp.]